MTEEVPSLAQFEGNLALIGAGKMGSAMLEGWLTHGLDAVRIVVLDPHPTASVAMLVEQGLVLNPPAEGWRKPDVAILAVKPQVAESIVAALPTLLGPDTLLVSIMAGRTLASLEAAHPGGAIVRAMPNTPGSIGCGITVAVGNSAVTAEHRHRAATLLRALGPVEWVEDEGFMDAVTAVSGSGPAYVFLLAETLARAAVEAGLPADLADRLARQTVAGAGQLLAQSPLDPETLRKNVTSPNGTTAAALDVLLGPAGLDDLMVRAVAQAAARSRELAQ